MSTTQFQAAAFATQAKNGYAIGDIVDRVAFTIDEQEFYNWDSRYAMAHELAESYSGWCEIKCYEF